MQSQQYENACSKALEKCIQLCRKCKNSCMTTGHTECASACEVCMMTCAALLNCCQTKCCEVEPNTGNPLKQELMDAVIAACKHCAVICNSHDHSHCKSCSKACLDCIDSIQGQQESRSYGYNRKQASSVKEAIDLLNDGDSYGRRIDQVKLKNKNTTWVITKRGNKFDVNTADHNIIKAKGNASSIKQINDHINFWS
jgi:hypothetical protein